MARQLTDKERKQIIADYVKCQNYREVGRKHGVSYATVTRIVKAASADVSQKVAQKAEENTQDVLAYMDSQSARVKSVISKLLTAMETKAENVDFLTSVKDLATAYGIMIDKEFKRLEIEQARNAKAEQGNFNNINEGILSIADLIHNPRPNRELPKDGAE